MHPPRRVLQAWARAPEPRATRSDDTGSPRALMSPRSAGAARFSGGSQPNAHASYFRAFCAGAAPHAHLPPCATRDAVCVRAVRHARLVGALGAACRARVAPAAKQRATLPSGTAAFAFPGEPCTHLRGSISGFGTIIRSQVTFVFHGMGESPTAGPKLLAQGVDVLHCLLSRLRVAPPRALLAPCIAEQDLVSHTDPFDAGMSL